LSIVKTLDGPRVRVVSPVVKEKEKEKVNDIKTLPKILTAE